MQLKLDIEVVVLVEVKDSPAEAKAELKAELSMQNDDVTDSWQNVNDVNWFSVVVRIELLLENTLRNRLRKQQDNWQREWNFSSLNLRSLFTLVLCLIRVLSF